MTARQVVTLVLILLAFALTLWVKEVYGPRASSRPLLPVDQPPASG